ncbi:peptidase [Paracoccus endophyticus]|uniref:peptidase n=1 Tax=Paracoccus endophyticus TaxID=2233774 RepID=UPI000DD8C933|nr:peptidase [Paracoccus endophyticus]
MTYCIGFLVREGLVMMADTRTNAGVDNVSTYRKLRVHANDGDRLIVSASAGSLSTTQEAVQRLQHGVPNPETGDADTFESVASIHEAARAAGRAVRAARDGMESLQQDHVSFDATLLVGGAVGGEPLRLFLVYSAGNCIECGADTPYLQIGEHKYGKPILDRVLTHDTGLYEAVKVGLISYSSTMRSNLAVGLPIDIVTARQGRPGAELVHRIEAGDRYFADLSRSWSEVINQACASTPPVPFVPAR